MFCFPLNFCDHKKWVTGFATIGGTATRRIMIYTFRQNSVQFSKIKINDEHDLPSGRVCLLFAGMERNAVGEELGSVLQDFREIRVLKLNLKLMGAGIPDSSVFPLKFWIGLGSPLLSRIPRPAAIGRNKIIWDLGNAWWSRFGQMIDRWIMKKCKLYVFKK